MNIGPPIRGQSFVLYVGLYSRSDPNVFQVNPTLAAGDVKVSQDGGAEGNLNTLPVVTPASSTSVKITVSASEMDADNVVITFRDAAGAEWCDLKVTIQPSGLGVPGTVNADGSETTTSFKTSLTQASNFFNNAFILFTDGALQGQARKISTYVSTNGVITVATAFTSAPANNDPFLIIGRSE